MTVIDGRAYRLTRLQLESLKTMASGLTNADEAACLGEGHTADAIKDRRRRVREKLGARTNPHAVAIAFRAGILQ